ncbi:hemin uptake protein HemP [Novipirellula sp. SH528]|uniref:hemin uptake protein HemP n=1 Tax=Novipirellula sp. SH528 TaxID=3454466 RepID=UPI003F9F6A0A
MTDSEPSDPAVPTPSNWASSESLPRIVPSSELLDGRREVWIEHGPEMYRLRLTASGKLYLTK